VLTDVGEEGTGSDFGEDGAGGGALEASGLRDGAGAPVLLR
jgi:hypothetical protein